MESANVSRKLCLCEVIGIVVGFRAQCFCFLNHTHCQRVPKGVLAFGSTQAKIMSDC